jgi:uncharacterized protein YjbK
MDFEAMKMERGSKIFWEELPANTILKKKTKSKVSMSRR